MREQVYSKHTFRMAAILGQLLCIPTTPLAVLPIYVQAEFDFHSRILF